VRDALRAPLKAAGLAAFTVGTLLFLLDPPSLAGAGNLLRFVAGGVLLLVITAWVSVLLMGRESMSEREFDRITRRSEELARSSDPTAGATGFDLLVVDAIDRLPDEFRDLLETVPVVVSHRGAEHHAYGRYYGDTVARDDYPDRIVLYQDTIERDFGHDEELLEAQVERTLRHELAHHMGWGERGVRELGL
jgi:predicted Zn-dependent protease with MMP-like domain